MGDGGEASLSISSATRLAEMEQVTGRHRGGLNISTSDGSSSEPLKVMFLRTVITGGKCAGWKINAPRFGDCMLVHFPTVLGVIS